MRDTVLLNVNMEEVITSLFQQYVIDHKLYEGTGGIDVLKRNISIFSGAIENYLIDHYGIDPEEADV